jgi:DNA invertase Pin-like site-specific DNA recombinase
MSSIIYTRVSTQEQADNNKSLDNQRDACKDYAAKKNLDVMKVFVEEGESAKTADRTKLKELLNYMRDNKGLVKNVIVWKVDRLARKTEDHLMLTGLFAKMGARLHSVTEPLEDTTAGKLMEHILASFAEFDNQVRAERSSKGMHSRMIEGGWVHQAPVGYSNAKNYDGVPSLEPDNQAANVALLLNEFSSGHYRQLDAAERAKSIYKIRTKKGNLVSNNSVYKMLRNPIYCGFISGKSLSEPIKGVHRALITEETYKTNQAILNGKRPKSPKPPSKYNPKWSLRKHIICAYCGNGMTGSISKGRGGKPHGYYHCTKCKGTKNERHLRLRKDDAEKAYLENVSHLTPPPYIMKLFRELIFRWWNQEYKCSADKKHSVENRIQELENKKIEANEMRIRGAISTDEELRLTKDKINADIDSFKIELMTAVDTYKQRDEAIDIAIDFMAHAEKIWSIAENADRARFQKMIFPDGISVNENLKFGTTRTGILYEEANLLNDAISTIKKTQHDVESTLAGAPGRLSNLLWCNIFF